MLSISVLSRPAFLAYLYALLTLMGMKIKHNILGGVKVSALLIIIVYIYFVNLCTNNFRDENRIQDFNCRANAHTNNTKV